MPVTLNLKQTEQLTNGLRFSRDSGVLLAPVKRLVLDPEQPRTVIIEEDLSELRNDIDLWREAGHGLVGSGIMEPLKCRWEPGAILADGTIRKDAKLYVWDGGKKLRVTQPDYDWLPIVFDDLDSKEARSAALRTSIHNRGHTPIEQGHAFAAEMKDTGVDYRAMAKKYSVDKGYIENRVNLLKCTPDVQQFAAKNPAKMSHALAMRPVKDAVFRRELIDLAEHGASVKEIEGEIQRVEAEKALLKDSQKAPDTHTQSRQARAAQQGSAPVSRGEEIIGDTVKDAARAISEAMSELIIQARRARLDIKSWDKHATATKKDWEELFAELSPLAPKQ